MASSPATHATISVAPMPALSPSKCPPPPRSRSPGSSPQMDAPPRCLSCACFWFSFCFTPFRFGFGRGGCPRLRHTRTCGRLGRSRGLAFPTGSCAFFPSRFHLGRAATRTPPFLKSIRPTTTVHLGDVSSTCRHCFVRLAVLPIRSILREFNQTVSGRKNEPRSFLVHWTSAGIRPHFRGFSPNDGFGALAFSATSRTCQ